MKIYVDARAFRGGNGSKDRPFQHINDAAQIARPGDEVIVAPGIYREYVNPKNAGTDDARIIYRSKKPLGAVITGAEEVKNWCPYKGTVWICRVDNSIFGNYNPYTTYVYGDWYFAGRSKHTGCVYLNDKMMYETDTLEDCIRGEIYECSWEPEASIYKWYTEQDNHTTVIYANFHDKNPNEECIEINVRRECFLPSKTGIDYITVRGFHICKAATTWAPPAAYQDGMIGPHWSKGWIIEDCEISNSKCAGISLGKYLDPDNEHYFTNKHVKSPTQMERDAVCRGQYHGWLKEHVGSHIIRRCNIHHCEQGGIIGRMGGVFSIIEDNHIHHINNMMELGGAEIAGIKMHAAIDVIYRRNYIHHCTMGIWCDWEAQGTRITQNLLHDNQKPAFAKQLKGAMMSQDLFVEVSHGPTLIDNNILLSGIDHRNIIGDKILASPRFSRNLILTAQRSYCIPIFLRNTKDTLLYIYGCFSFRTVGIVQDYAFGLPIFNCHRNAICRIVFINDVSFYHILCGVQLISGVTHLRENFFDGICSRLQCRSD